MGVAAHFAEIIVLEGAMSYFFKVAIRFHPDHPWTKALIYSLSRVLVELFSEQK